MKKCPICENPSEEKAYIETYISPFNNQEYKLYHCESCGLEWWEPLEIIPEFYENEVLENYISFHEGTRLKLEQNHQAFFKYFPSEVKGKLLDVGCGDGVFLREAKKHGFEVYGIDFDRKSVEIAKRSVGVDTIYAMGLEEFYHYVKERNLKFDVITFFEVLEHQDKPKEFLNMVKDLLKEGGYIAGSVPNRESPFQIYLHQTLYHYVDHPPHHFLRFSKDSLENTIKMLGFKNVKVYKLDFPKEELPSYIEKRLLGDIDKIKIWLKGKILGNSRFAKTVAIEDIGNIKPSLAAQVLKLLKRTRNLILLPFTLLYLNKIKENGINLYFQAMKKMNNILFIIP